MMPETESSSDRQLPGVSVVLAIRNEAEHLDNCLHALVNLNYPREKIEILLVDGMSGDNTPAILADWAGRDSRIRTLQNRQLTVSYGMNMGIAAARYDYILWVSGHAILQPNHIRQCLRSMHETGAAAVGGVLTTRGTTKVGRINAAVLSHPFGVGGAEHRVGGRSGWVTVVTMALYRKAAILAAGGFDESLPRSQDNDLHARMNKLGLRSYLNVEINPVYLCRNTLQRLLRQARNNGFWNVMLMRRGHGGLSLRHFVPMAFVGGQALLLLIGLFVHPALYVLRAALAIYLASAIVASIQVGLRERLNWQIPLLPIWFAALHYAYGFSSWLGLFRKKDFDRRSADE
jgi:succinoglycan biosynthesis protein ExoA